MTKYFPWQRKYQSPILRQLEIFGVAFKLLFYLLLDKLLGNNSSHQRHRRARWLVRRMLDLGPTFIKIGQALSTRPDLIPLEYVEEFSKLQDRVPEFSGEEAIAIVEAELDNSIHNLFLDFESIPLAAASLGQVHKALLLTGEEVVVKVQRQGLEALFNLDFKVIHRGISLCNKFIPGLRKYELKAIYQEFFDLLYLEIDYLHEGKNAERFRENFKNYPQVLVPQVYWQYTSKKVLTLEYLPGIKINDRQALEASGINTDKVIQLGICCYLKQLLEDGFFQSDPHPGNMAVNPEGKIIFYDFGTMAEVKSMEKDQMVKTFFAVLRKDADEVLNTLMYMGLIQPVSDMTPVKRLVGFLLEKFRDKPIDIKALQELSAEIYIMFEQQPFRLPPQLTFIIKSLTTLDGIARALDPQYNLLAASQPFVRNIARSSRKGNLVSVLAQQATDFIKYRLQQPSKTEVLIKSLETKLAQGELQLRVRSLESDRLLKRINLGIKTLIYACLTGFTLLAATILLSTAYSTLAAGAFSLSGFLFLILLRSLIALSIQEKLD
ncbi:MAG: AarF/ABC1/UbiB kinase family protein [Gomphosphaeria aponina SAG 52.96 = DSM 107014]|uniref:AarF/ABC1/UbiB kinase family protein n=1 Tax=Gomphosphaeria aponina SAG 52.96 = DSM 107014 TaxID=1521640 RepID=A0A941GT98_9CHRO|nr:AarF/ABC1/UbiB kinase family protein [Gomphosphaeria aponina SAG 52.96 = DSM 107014]